MNKLLTLEERKQTYDNNAKSVDKRIIICAGTACIANGALKVYDEFVKQLTARNINAKVELKDDKHGVLISGSGCQGFCQMGPLVTVYPKTTLYCLVKTGDVEEIIDKTILKDEAVTRLLYHQPGTNDVYELMDDVPFYHNQNRFVLYNCGHIDPNDINEYIAKGGYFSARRALKEMTDEQVCKEVIASGLRGRGGGGFPTGLKWDLTRKQPKGDKYIICNADEGDPGAFMDRSVMEGNPHSVIEGMIVAAKAVGANMGYVYIRAEYPLAVKNIKRAVKDAREAGILGKSILDSDFNFDITVMEGAGAFVCGEETALMASIEGRRGMPTPKPPFPAEKGLFGKPTVINNVETLSSVPIIMQFGPDKFASMGTESSKGTKTFALTGNVANTGLIEVPLGTTLRTIISDIAGGVVNQDGSISPSDFKAVQIGGPSGGCLTQEHLDLPLDFDSLKSVGAMVGSGGLVVMNKNTCMVEIARFFMQFTKNESCGKCVVCREGTKQMLNMLIDITEGRATIKTIEVLEELAQVVMKGSLCALGKTAPNPVISTLKYFRDEYIAHVVDKRCPAGACKALQKYTIDDKCIGCGLCKRKCPVGAIEGVVKGIHIIDETKCIKCGVCAEACKFKAISLG